MNGPETLEAEALPRWKSALAVVARPDEEAIALGGVLGELARRGTEITLLSLSHGRGRPDETAAKRSELESAAAILGVTRTLVLEIDEAALSLESPATLAEGVTEVVRRTGSEALVVLDYSAVPDHGEATSAALAAAETLDLPLLAWTLPSDVAEQLNDEFGTSYSGVEDAEIDLVLSVDRGRQRVAGLAQGQQPALVRRVELLGDSEHLRWLRLVGDVEWAEEPSPAPFESSKPRVIRAPDGFDAVPVFPPSLEPAPEPATGTPPATVTVPARRKPGPTGPESVLVEHHEGETLRVSVRGFSFVVDPGGPDEEAEDGPTPHEIFVAGLASCVGWYARRYLRRQRIDPTGLAVETLFTLSEQQTRLASVEVRVHVPVELTEKQERGLLEFAARCSTYRAFNDPPELSLTLA